MTAEPRTTPSRDYGSKVVAVEPGGNEPHPRRRAARPPDQLFWTWTSPNLEFATIFVGVLSVLVFGLTFGQAVAAILLGNGLAALGARRALGAGPAAGVPQMVLGRLAFGYRGNVLPAGLMTITSGFGWFAVNSVSASFALDALTGLPAPCWLLVLVVLVAGRRRVLRAQPGAGVRARRVPRARGDLRDRRGDRAGAVGPVVAARRTAAPAGSAASCSPRCGLRLHRRLEPVRRRLRPLPARRQPARCASGSPPGVGLFVSTSLLMIVGAASVSASTAVGSARTTRPPPSPALLPGFLGRADAPRDRARRGRRQRAQRLLRRDGVPVRWASTIPLERARAVVAVAFGVVGLRHRAARPR